MFLMLKLLWQYRHYIVNSIRTEFNARFARSSLGAMWMIFNPLAQVAIYALILLLGVIALASGEQAYGAWLAAVGSAPSIVLHLLVLVAAIYHAVTWFAVSPKAMPPIRIGGEPVPPHMIIAGQYAASVVASVIVLAVAFGG